MLWHLFYVIPALVGSAPVANLTLEHQQFLKSFIGILSAFRFPKDRVFVYNDWDNQSISGIGRFAFMTVGKDLVSVIGLTKLELLAVVAHKLGHWTQNRIAHTAALYSVILVCFLPLFTYLIRSKSFYKSFGISIKREIPFGIGLILITGLAQLLVFFLKPIVHFFDHRMEYQADVFAARLGHGNDLTEAFKKLYPDSLKLADPLYSLFVSSHPVLSKRVAAIAEVIKKVDERGA